MASWWDVLLESAYTEALVILLAYFMLATLCDYLIARYSKKLLKEDDSSLVGRILNIIYKPLYLLLIIAGLYFAARSFSMPSNIALWTDRVFFVVATLISFHMISKVVGVLISSWLKVNKRYEKTPELITMFISVVLYIIAGLVILDYFNVKISPILATLGVGGIAIGLALQDTLKDFIAGLHIISDRPIRVNDFIEIEGKELRGYVEDIGWRSTRIRTLPNNFVIIPNSVLSNSILINTNMPQKEQALLVEVGVDYTSDLEKVEKTTVKVAKKIQKSVEGAIEDFEPFIRFHTFGDNNINFTVILRIKEYVNKFLVRNEFMKALHKEYKKQGIEISWPIRKVYDMKK